MKENVSFGLGCASSVTWLVVLVIQVRAYGVRRWLRLGAGMGAEVKRVEHEMRDLEEKIR